MPDSGGDNWRLAVVLSGMALGLNDVWRLPVLLVQHPAPVFLGLYLLFLLVLGLPLLTAEIVLGRAAPGHPRLILGAWATASRASPLWAYLGVLMLVAVGIVLSYLSVVAGWFLGLIARAASGGFDGLGLQGARAVFYTFASDPEKLMGWHTVFVAVMIAVVSRPLRRGIVPVEIFLVVVAFILATILAMHSIAYFGPDAMAPLWSSPSLQWPGFELIGDALVQAFFTLGVAMGVYMVLTPKLAPRRGVAVVPIVLVVDIAFTMIALIVVAPAIVGLNPMAQVGLSLATESIPAALGAAPYGKAAIVLFFALMVILLISTGLLLMEALAGWIQYRRRCDRVTAAALAGLLVWALGLISVVSVNIYAFEFEFMQQDRRLGMFDVLNVLSSQMLIPLAGLVLACFAGWVVNRELLAFYFSSKRVLGWWLFAVRYPAVLLSLSVFVFLILNALFVDATG